jgi:hypothetical protein
LSLKFHAVVIRKRKEPTLLKTGVKMNFTFMTLLLVGGLFIALLGFLEVGRRIGRAVKAKYGKEPAAGAVDAAVYGLLGLLIAFTFSGAATRFEARRHLIVEEANAIGTAYLRLDLLPAEAQEALKDKFRQYVDLRLEVYRKLPDIEAAKAALADSQALQAEIWSRAVAASRAATPQPAAMLLLPALNQMIDITTTRTVAAQNHPPSIIFIMLIVLALMSALLAGYSIAGSRNIIHMLVFAAILAITVYVILDLEYPRLGLIQIDAADQVLVEMRQGMK